MTLEYNEYVHDDFDAFDGGCSTNSENMEYVDDTFDTFDGFDGDRGTGSENRE